MVSGTLFAHQRYNAEEWNGSEFTEYKGDEKIKFSQTEGITNDIINNRL